MEKMIITRENLTESIKNLQQYLLQIKIARKDAIRYTLSIEEIVDILLQNSTENKVNLQINSFLGTTTIRIICDGKEVTRNQLSQYCLKLEEQDDEEYNLALQNMMQKIMGNDIAIQYIKGKNICTINVKRCKYENIVNILFALVLGIGAGMLLKMFTPTTFCSSISNNIFASIFAIFMNALKMIVGPLIFFAIASSIAGLSDLRMFGRTAVKIVICYLFTSAIAISLGYGVYQIFPIGDSSLQSAVTNNATNIISTSENLEISLKDTVINIVPSNIVAPFADNNMLQIIFMAIILGIAVGALERVYPNAQKALSCMNGIVSKITKIIIEFMPFVVFCSMAKMVIDIEVENMIKIATWLLVVYIAEFLMIIVYCILLIIFGRLNPLHFIRGFFPAMVTAYSLNSSNAAMPTTINCCEKLGINKKIYSFSIPLGATINMDGSCIFLIISSLFMAKIFGVTITTNELATLFVAIMALSIGAPGVPNAGLVCLSMLLPLVGIPAEAISIIIALYVLVGMGLTVVNVTGDATISTIVAKTEKLLDVEKYKAN